MPLESSWTDNKIQCDILDGKMPELPETYKDMNIYDSFTWLINHHKDDNEGVKLDCVTSTQGTGEALYLYIALERVDEIWRNSNSHQIVDKAVFPKINTKHEPEKFACAILDVFNGELFDSGEENCLEGVFACPVCLNEDEDFFWLKLKGLNKKMSKILDEDYFIQGLKNGRPYFRAVLGIS